MLIKLNSIQCWGTVKAFDVGNEMVIFVFSIKFEFHSRSKVEISWILGFTDLQFRKKRLTFRWEAEQIDCKVCFDFKSFSFSFFQFLGHVTNEHKIWKLERDSN